MITLITGLPGSGKSLFAVRELVKNSKSEDIRPAFADIDGLDYDRLRAFPLEDATAWHELPDGSIIVMDECQRVFPPRSNGSKVPPHVSMLETHRHHGHDLYLITQAPRLLDYHVRSLVGRHIHITRPFGTTRPRVYTYDGVNDKPEPERKPVPSKQKLERELFGYYHSATEHTHKSRLPGKVWAAMLGIPAIILGTGYFAVASMQNNMTDGVSIEIAEAELPPARFESYKLRDGVLESASIQVPGGLFSAQDFDWIEAGSTFVLRREGRSVARVLSPPSYRLAWPVVAPGAL